MGINYLAEINSKAVLEPIIATPCDTVSRRYDVYYISLKGPPDEAGREKTYWEEWGGRYDMPESLRVEIYITDWLKQTSTFNDVLTIPFMFYIDSETSRLYFNIPKHPWLYETWEAQLAKNNGFLHTVKDPLNPSDAYIDGDYLPVILDKPSDNRKLADPLHGVNLFLTFGIKLDNSGGGFDLIRPEAYFNRPARLYKTWKDNPSYQDFVMIRTGIADGISIDKDGVSFSCAEKFRTLEQDVCRLITEDEWEINTTDAAGKPLPLVFGTQEVQLIKILENDMARFTGVDNNDKPVNIDFSSVTGVYAVVDGEDISLDYEISGAEIIALNTAKKIKFYSGSVETEVKLKKTADMPERFLAAEYITSIAGVYDKEGAPLAYTRDGLVITAPPEAEYARITGYTENRLGDIVIKLISELAGVLYIGEFWNIAETEAYRNTSPRLDIAIKSGTVRSAVTEVLKSDMVYLIQKNNAVFTLRRWGERYGVFEIEDYLHTQHPSKNWNDGQKYWFSSCVVKYAKNDRTGEFTRRYLMNETENTIQGKYNRKKTAEFETSLTTAADAKSMADRLSGRFNFLKETVSVGVGKDTGEINLLDTVLIKIAVNGRVYSDIEKWIVKEIDPAQDKMTLEEI